LNKYPSVVQAKSACDKWVSEGGVYILNTPEYLEKNPPSSTGKSYLFKKQTLKINIRYCKQELETKQYLGYQRSIKKNTIINSQKYCPAKSDFEIKKCARDPKGTEYFLKKNFYYFYY
tara:strand:+ start:492 stop:845 length:354 start_codon:yes stop_codon:yes gene_type:complete